MAEYIKREAAIKAAEHAYHEWNIAMAAADGAREINLVYKRQELCKAVASVFKRAPAADIAPVRHAKWISEEHEDRVSPTMTHKYTWYYCSECGRRLVGYSKLSDAPYCHCGAKMDGGDEAAEKAMEEDEQDD